MTPKAVTLILSFPIAMMPLDLKRHTVPHLKVLNSGLDP